MDTFNAKNSVHDSICLAEILRTIREAVLVVGSNMQVRASNPAAEEVFVRTDDGLDGKRLSEVLRDFPLHESFRKTIADRKPNDLRLELIDTTRRIFDVHVAPLDLPGEHAAIGFFHEITHIERLERVRQEFLSNVSHELRTPLTSIIAFIETLTDGPLEDNADTHRFLEIIRKNAERMHLLINDVSELSSIEGGKIRVDPVALNLGALVSEITESLTALSTSRTVEVLNEVPSDFQVFADLVRLQQMLTNLIDNAIKFNREGGSVRISAASDGAFDRILVSDTGEGIGREHLSRIFERFYRVDRARSRSVGGTGLGLAIVKHLALLHGGSVTVESRRGEGTTFQINLPREGANR
ncbi:MAG: ATP-binding protein [Pyrinomonadaceae bacterium]